MAASTVQKVYAEGLYRASLARKETDAVGEEISALAGLLDRSPRFRTFLATPGIPAEEKRQALRRILSGRASPTVLHFLLVLTDKRRLPFLKGIAAEYQRLLDAGNGVLRGEIAVATAEGEAAAPRIERALSAHIARRVVLSARRQSALLGGCLVQVGDFLVDGSFRTKLKALKRHLLAKNPVA